MQNNRVNAGWSEINRCREQVRLQYPSIWDIPLIHDGRAQARHEIRAEDSLLDIGGGGRYLEDFLRGQGFKGVYKSMDVDRSTRQEYYSLSDVNEQFDVVTMLEVVEHMLPDEYMHTLGLIGNILRNNGKLIMSTPNIYHPSVFHVDAEHVRAYSYEELAGRASCVGFGNIELFRVHPREPLKWRIARRIMHPLLNKYLGIDFAAGILLVCRNQRVAT